jgi:hypothetical protein
VVLSVQIDARKIYKKEEPTQFQIFKDLPNQRERVEQANSQNNLNSSNFSKKSILSGGLIPLTFTQLNEYGLTIMSERRSGEQEFESKYTVVPLSDEKYSLSKIDQKIFLKSKLKNKPGFLKLYLKRVNGNEQGNSQIIIVKERGGQKKTVYVGFFNIKI